MGINLQKLIREKHAAKLNQAEEAARAQQPATTVGGTRMKPNALDVAREQNRGALNLQALRNQGAKTSAPLGGGGGDGDGGALANAHGNYLSNQDKNQAALNLQKLAGEQDYKLQELKNLGAENVQRLENEGNDPYPGGEDDKSTSTGPTEMASNLNLNPNSLSRGLLPQAQNALGRPSIDLRAMNPRLGGGLSTSGQTPTAQQLEEDLMRRLGRY